MNNENEYAYDADCEISSINLETTSCASRTFDIDEIDIEDAPQGRRYAQIEEDEKKHSDFITDVRLDGVLDECDSCSIECGSLLFMELLSHAFLLSEEEAKSYSAKLCDSCDMCAAMKDALKD